MIDWKNKLDVLKSNLPLVEEAKEDVKVDSNVNKLQKEPLRVELDKRNGKPATLVTEFLGSEDELKELAKTLKVKCGAGGSSRDGEILVQGDFRIKIAELLLGMGFKVKRINFK
jgi:translation initiation factor 1